MRAEGVGRRMIGVDRLQSQDEADIVFGKIEIGTKTDKKNKIKKEIPME